MTRWIVILIIGLSLRLTLAWGMYGNYDQSSYQIVTDIMQRGGNVYAETARYNYSPLWMNVLYTLRGMSDATGLPFHAVVRNFLTVVDLLSAALLVLIARHVSNASGFLVFAVYWLNPGSIITVGYHGQFEILAMLPVLVAIALHFRWQDKRKHLAIWVLLTLAIIVKHNAVFVVWPLLVYLYGWRRSIVSMVASGGVFALTFAPYWSTGADGIIAHVFQYQSQTGVYGLSVFTPASLNLLIMGGVMFAAPIVLRRPSMIDTLTISILATFVVTRGFGVHYMIYLFAMCAFTRVHWSWMYAAGVIVVIVHFYEMADTVITGVVSSIAMLSLWPLIAMWLATALIQPKFAAKPRLVRALAS